MSSSEEKRENGSAMLAIGWVMILFASLVFFFQPAAVKLGESRFAIIARVSGGHRRDPGADWNPDPATESVKKAISN